MNGLLIVLKHRPPLGVIVQNEWYSAFTVHKVTITTGKVGSVQTWVDHC